MRAIAVMAVVLFHYRVNFVPGGFVGVDIFFVISGYLMTSIITGRLDQGRFSLLGFYGDRARRIIPPLCGLLIPLVGFGAFLIDPTTFHRLAASAVSAVFFYSNIAFWREAGYFDAQNDMKWLLHSWSLSFEWQFYLVYPLLTLLLHRFLPGKAMRLALLWLLALLSLAFCVSWTATDPGTAFYLLPFRAWEMLAGGIVALQFDAPRERDTAISRTLFGGGLGLIAVALFGLDRATPWPGLAALVPVLGTCLVIAARQRSRLTAHPVVQAVGDWSYVIYLWHWPIAVAALYLGFVRVHTPRGTIIAELLILLILMLAFAYGVKTLQPLWTRRSTTGLRVTRFVSAWQICGLGAFLMAQSARVATPVGLLYPAECDGLGNTGELRFCSVGHGRRHVLFIGDSQVMQIYARFTEALATRYDSAFTFLTAAGCPPVPGVDRTPAGLSCGAFIGKAFEAAENGDYNRIVMASRWDILKPMNNLDQLFASFTAKLTAFKHSGKTVAILSETPVPEIDVTQELLRRRFFRQDTQDVEYISRESLEAGLATIKPRLKAATASAGASFIDPLDYLCTGNRCAMVNEKGESLFFDQSHFRTEAVISPRFQFVEEAAGLRRSEATTQR